MMTAIDSYTRRPLGPIRYSRRPLDVEAIYFDGTARCADAIAHWLGNPDGLIADTKSDRKGNETCALFVPVGPGLIPVKPRQMLVKPISTDGAPLPALYVLDSFDFTGIYTNARPVAPSAPQPRPGLIARLRAWLAALPLPLAPRS